jgi:beta-glucanase (GH16 family)
MIRMELARTRPIFKPIGGQMHARLASFSIVALTVLATGFIHDAQANAASPYVQLDLHSVVDGSQVTSYATVGSAVNKDVQSFGICVRDASNANLDYAKLATARITPTGTTITRSKNFNAGTYTYFPCLYADGAWFNVGTAKSFVVGGTAPPSSSPPSTTTPPSSTSPSTTAPSSTPPSTTAPSTSVVSTTSPTSTSVATSHTIFLDNFDGPVNSLPDASKWGYEVGGNGWGNNELEYYKDGDPDNSSMDGQGNLRITVRAEQFGGSNYTSARIRTQGRFDFLYGTMEARIKIPAGSGLWPAFWTLGTNNNPSQPDVWPNLGEIDVMEAVNSDNGYSATTHAGPSDWSKYKYSAIPARDGVFHIYSAKWSPGTIAFYVDGTLVTTVTKSQTPAGHTWPFDSVHQYLLLNVAMGGNYPGAPDGSAALPATMLVDYVKVTQ